MSVLLILYRKDLLLTFYNISVNRVEVTNWKIFLSYIFNSSF